MRSWGESLLSVLLLRISYKHLKKGNIILNKVQMYLNVRGNDTQVEIQARTVSSSTIDPPGRIEPKPL